ncbi:MAG TPA: YezD family protein [Verrucomicrobiae bacterium]
MSQIQSKIPVGRASDLKWVDLVTQQVTSLRFGVVEIVVHDSRVIQIEKTERLRFDKNENRTD